MKRIWITMELKPLFPGRSFPREVRCVAGTFHDISVQFITELFL